ncbi:MAG: hypothetical protein K2Y37_12365 [Pirellulales bacterium]|nr:hypothetical protein [Pirellulales bacterium]
MPRRHPLLLLVFFVMVLALLLLPAPVSTRRGAALMDLSHAPLFALVTLVSFYSLPPVLRSARSAIAVGLFVIGVGGALEIVQELTGRSANWLDFRANVLGVSAALLFTWARDSAGATRGWALRGAALAALVAASIPSSVILWDCWRQHRDLPMIASFEDDLELSRWRSNRARVTRSPLHATAGQFSFCVEMGARQYPGVYMLWPPNDWLGAVHRACGPGDAAELVVDFWLSDGPPLNVIVKVVDLNHTYRVKNDCYERPVRLSVGPSQVRISLDEIARSPRTRLLDLSHVRLLQFYVESLERPRTVFIDNIHLKGGASISSRNDPSIGRTGERVQ